PAAISARLKRSTMALAHQYWMNDGSSGSGIFSLLTDGSFTDDMGGTGAWSFLPTPPRVLLQYDAGFACDALLPGSVLPTDQVRGLRLGRARHGAVGIYLNKTVCPVPGTTGPLASGRVNIAPCRRRLRS